MGVVLTDLFSFSSISNFSSFLSEVILVSVGGSPLHSNSDWSEDDHKASEYDNHDVPSSLPVGLGHQLQVAK